MCVKCTQVIPLPPLPARCSPKSYSPFTNLAPLKGSHPPFSGKLHEVWVTMGTLCVSSHLQKEWRDYNSLGQGSSGADTDKCYYSFVQCHVHVSTITLCMRCVHVSTITLCMRCVHVSTITLCMRCMCWCLSACSGVCVFMLH